jgi:hypothetical protein
MRKIAQCGKAACTRSSFHYMAGLLTEKGKRRKTMIKKTMAAMTLMGAVIMCLGLSGCTSPVNGLMESPAESPTPDPADASKLLCSFAFDALGVDGVIDEANRVITIACPVKASLTSLVASFTTTGESVSVSGLAQEGGSTVNDFRRPLIYAVRAKDGSCREYTVIARCMVSLQPRQ